jgi:spermidine synthase
MEGRMKTSRATLFFMVLALAPGLAAAAPPAAAPPPAPAQATSSAGAAECGTDNLLAGKTPSQVQDLQGEAALLTDGAVGPEGAQWDAPVAVTFSTGAGFVTYDLGRPREIGAVHIQADANDTYKLTGSLDGTPGSFKILREIENVVDEKGHGLRSRSGLVVPPATVRYLRIGEGLGDNAFSLSEVAAYCKPPAPFPPNLRQVDAPLAQTGGTAKPGGAIDVRDDNTSPPFFLLIAAAALALLGWGAALGGKARGAAAAAAAEAGASAPVAPDAPSPAARSRWSSHDLIRLMFVASGCAALIYEIVWFHLLRLVIGASALSVGIVLASFMGGMFLGSMLFARYIRPGRNTLRVYAAIELGIGLFGLLMPLLLPAVRYLYVGLFGYGAVGIALRAVIAGVLLLPPTALMGATLPAVARRYTSGRRGMSGLAGLYTANIAGAVLGSLLSAFYLLAAWDVWVATFVAATLNFAVGGSALRLSRRRQDEEAVVTAAPAPSTQTPTPARTVKLVFLAAALSGLTSLGAQVVWTRILTLLFGATVYAFAIILAVLLAGLGLGSHLASYLLRRGLNPLRGLAWSQLLLIPTLLLAGHLISQVLPFASPSSGIPVRALHALHVLRAIDIILPSAILWGMSFPLALAAAGAGHGDTGRSSAHVYAANTVGAIAGALLVSFWAIPAFGTRWAQQALVVGAALSSAAVFYAIARAPRQPGRRVISPAWALAAGALGAAFLPGLSTAFLAHGRYIWWVDPRDQYPYVSEGAASTVAVHVAPSGFRNFHVSGRVEASNNPNDMRLQRLLGHLSALAHPKPESVLVVGLGAGVTAGALILHPEVKRMVICEIEPRVVGAAEQFAKENNGVLKDKRVELVFDDARHYLATTREKFDVITSDPIHPWVRGNSVLFSREYYAIVSSHLKPGGVATQWVPLYETSEEAIKIQMRTFMDAFPEGTVWNSHAAGKGYDVVLIGRTEPLSLDLNRIGIRMREPYIGQSLREVKIHGVTDLMATYATSGRDMAGWLQGVPINRDFSLKLEYISGMALNTKEADPIYNHMVAGRQYPQKLFIAPPELDAELRRRLAPKK